MFRFLQKTQNRLQNCWYRYKTIFKIEIYYIIVYSPTYIYKIYKAIKFITCKPRISPHYDVRFAHSTLPVGPVNSAGSVNDDCIWTHRIMKQNSGTCPRNIFILLLEIRAYLHFQYRENLSGTNCARQVHESLAPKISSQCRQVKVFFGRSKNFLCIELK